MTLTTLICILSAANTVMIALLVFGVGLIGEGLQKRDQEVD